MVRILLSFAAALTACAPSPQENAMRSAGSGPERSAPDPGAAASPAPAVPADAPREAAGRRTLSTAFVMIGPDGRLTVERQDGHVLVLRDVVMRARDYCGRHVEGGSAGSKYCGGYAEVAAARPGGGPQPAEPDLAASNPLDPKRRPADRD